MKAIKAVYNFIVGDMIILVGVLVAVVVLALFNAIPALQPLRIIAGVFLVVAVLAVLSATLMREALGNK